MAEPIVGVLVGDEWAWTSAFLSEINRRQVGVRAELVRLEGTHLAATPPYAAIIDRISHEIPYYRTFLKTAALAGTIVINDPFRCSANDRFSNASLVAHMGFAHPRMVALPSHSYVDGIPNEALRNLTYPIPWERHIRYLGGFPVVLRPVQDSHIRKVYVLESYDDLWHSYDQTGEEPMMLREHITWDRYIRCICIGAQRVIPIRYLPGGAGGPRYSLVAGYITDAEQHLLCESAIQINQALGYALNAIDFAFQGDRLIVVDATNPTLRCDVNLLTPYFFDQVVTAMADFVIELVTGDDQSHPQFIGPQRVSTTARPSS